MEYIDNSDKMQFIDAPEQQEESAFDTYFNQKIVPLVEEDNCLKDKYHSRFWGYVWSITFIISANVLFVLFNALMNKHSVNYEQLVLFGIVAASFAIWPVFRYYREPRQDIFDVFLQYYGDWKHKTTGEVKLVHAPIIPSHDSVSASHNISNDVGDVKVEIRDTLYTKNSVLFGKSREKKISSGVIVYLTFPDKFAGTLLVFDKSGFYRKSKFPGLDAVSPRMEIPASNYFKCFTDNTDFAQQIMLSLFYETILDMKEAFTAKNMYLQIQDNFIRIYFEGSTLYFDNYKFWSRKIDKNKFLQMNTEFEKTFNFIQIIKALVE
ncbi:MAG: DUF3137 domain-containing protein [Alphaproteobacteria bacterium]|nr:DUF3137 domain-containing protein [Alphaproteobacteria bacterium]